MHLIRAHFKERLAEDFMTELFMMITLYSFLTVFIKAYVVGTHLNCPKSRQFKSVPTCFDKGKDTNTWAVTWRLWNPLNVHLIGVCAVIKLNTLFHLWPYLFSLLNKFIDLGDDDDDDLVFYVLSTLFKLYQDNGMVIIKKSVQKRNVQSWAEFCLQQDSNLWPCDPKLEVLITLSPRCLVYGRSEKQQCWLNGNQCRPWLNRSSKGKKHRYYCSLATRPIYKYVCHFFFLLFFFSFIFYFLIQCLASLWVNFSSVVISEIYCRIRNPDHIIYRLAKELNKPKYIYVYF